MTTDQQRDALLTMLDDLTGIIKAHEIESLSCDRDGEMFCECLREKAAEAGKLIEQVKGRE